MGDGPVSGTAGWRLHPDYRPHVQGLLASPFSHLRFAEALFLALPAQRGGAWLAALRAVLPITDATGPADPSAALAFTHGGLEAMGLERRALATFATPFQEGIHQADRQRRLGDAPDAGMLAPGGVRWGGNMPDPADPDRPAAPVTVHALLLVYADTQRETDDLLARIAPVLAAHGVVTAHRHSLSLRFDEQQRAREHFGFVDGVSQPVPYDAAGRVIVDGRDRPFPKDVWHGVLAGEVLMGHLNAHGEAAPGPLVPMPEPDDPMFAAAAALPKENAPEGWRDLGINGTYLVVRELLQDVPAFWHSMDAAAKQADRPGVDAAWIASRVIGRNMDGDPLCPGGVIAPPDATARANAFGFLGTDRHGLGCPVGSHMRRGNPRDGLAGDPKAGPDLLRAANNHRIMRRARKFGPDIADPRTPDGAERGLLFMCLNTDIERQFEFVQQTWVLNGTFGTLDGETDPLMGPEGDFTIPAAPLRIKVKVRTFITFAGGEYFFLPSIPALDYLAALKAPAP